MKKPVSYNNTTSRDYPEFDEERRVLTQLGLKLIQKLAESGREFITLDELYLTLQATTAGEQNGIQWAVCRMKTKGVIRSVFGQRAIYRVV